ncbi:MAG: eukaryotic-like serine/threonine-protein kinase [Acidimicrobiaceae bacterium]|nr:eukaryotic-like serine/threonine-protein kinase [Acidimicrobiaceae bacterium]
MGRVVAFALAREHAAGRAHGAVDADHLLIDASGAVTLAPSGVAIGGQARAEDDVRALGDLLFDLLAGAGPGESGASLGAHSAPNTWLRRVRAAGRGVVGRRPVPSRIAPSPAEALTAIARQACPPDGATPPSAATIAALIALRVPGARPPGRRPPSPDPALGQAAVAAPSPPSHQPPVPGPRLLGAACAVLLACVGVFALASLHRRAQRVDQAGPVGLGVEAAAGPPPSAAMPTRVWPAVDFHDGVLTTGAGRFTVGRAGDVVIAGDWLCARTSVPALLRPATGEVFVFDRWPAADEDVPSRPAGVVPGATGLRARGDAGRGCPALVAVKADGTTVPVEVPSLGDGREAGP